MESDKGEESLKHSLHDVLPSTSKMVCEQTVKEGSSQPTSLEVDYESLLDDLESVDDCINENEEIQYTYIGGYKTGDTNWTVISKQQEDDYISQFLNGQLTFSEYAARMDGNIQMPDDDALVAESSISYVEENTSSTCVVPNENDTKVNEVRKVRKRYIRRNLPPALKGLMGEANLRYARGEKQMAVDICLEIIRQVPTAPEPYHTLAGLYEELGHSDKSLQMSLIAAHLSPSDANQWINLAEVSLEQGNIKQAITCYTKAIKADEKLIDIHFKRAALLEKEGQKSVALKGFSKLLSILDPVKESDKILDLSKLVAEMYHKEKDLIKTKETLEIAFKKCPELIGSAHINLLLEVLLSLKDYSNCLDIFIKFCGVYFDIHNEGDLIHVENFTFSREIAIDLKVKLILCLIHLKSVKPLDNVVKSLLAENPDDFGDLYLDVAEAYMSEQFYEKALSLLSPLIASKSYSLPAVWLRYAECLKHLGNLEQSVDAYLRVIEQAPQHHDARIVAAELLTKLNRRDEAINILIQDDKCDIIDSELLYERCLLLKDKPDKEDDFLAAGQLFLSRHFIQIRRFEELKSLSNHRSNVYKKKIALKEIRMISGDPLPEDDRPDFTAGKRMPSIQEEWDIFMNMCNICLTKKKFPLLQRLTFSAQGSDRFLDYSKEIDIMCLMSSIYNNDSFLAFNYARQLVLRDIDAVRPWNVLNLVIIRGDDTRHNKFIMRLLSRNQTNATLSLLHANNCLVSGTYKYALNEYASAYRKEPSAVLAFLVGVVLSQMACQKFTAKKHALVSQAVAFFSKYQELRGPAGEQEFHYNLGRVYHQLGLLPPALHQYKLALEKRPSFIDEFGNSFDLSREAAFNIHLIYLQSGAIDMARLYLEKYIVI